MPGVGRYVNLGTTTFTKAVGSTVITFKGCQSVQLSDTGTPVADKGDNDLFHTFLRVFTRAFAANVSSRDFGVMTTLPSGTKGSFSTVFLDAEADVAGSVLSGSITVTMANARIITHNTQGQHAQMGTIGTSIQCWSSDGVTSPVTFAIAA